MPKSKVASIRALQELKGIVEERRSHKFSPAVGLAEKACSKIKSDLSLQIEKEIEEYAVEKYKQYGIEVVPVCRRSSNYKDSDIVRPELRLRIFDQSAEVAYRKVIEDNANASKVIDDWYFQAVQAVASQVDLPPTPEF
jgi:hypothetical protein